MDIIQILIILFIVYPFIKRIIDGIKEKGQPPGDIQQNQQDDSYDSSPWELPEYNTREESKTPPRPSGSWDDTLSEIEELLTGRPAQRKTEQKVPDTQTPVATQSKARYTEEQNKIQQTEKPIGSVDVSSELMDTENPIYKSLDEAPEVITEENSMKDYSQIIHDSETLRTVYVMREILDLPSSIRRLRR
ncbi:MAG: hypothetical protein WD267_01315 [Balneolales bacterium]